MFKSSILFFALLCFSSVILAAKKKGKARKTSTFATQAPYDSCRIDTPTLDDCSSFDDFNSESSYRTGDRVKHGNSIYQLVANVSVDEPSDEKICKQFQDCQIKEINWMLVANCHKQVVSDSDDSANSSTSSDELDI